MLWFHFTESICYPMVCVMHRNLLGKHFLFLYSCVIIIIIVVGEKIFSYFIIMKKKQSVVLCFIRQ